MPSQRSHRTDESKMAPDMHGSYWAAGVRIGAITRIVGMEVAPGLGDGIFWVGFVAVLLGRGAGPAGFALAAAARLGPRPSSRR